MKKNTAILAVAAERRAARELNSSPRHYAARSISGPGRLLFLLGILSLIWTSPLQAGKPRPPVAPSNLTATVASSSQINLKWTDNSANESGFIIQRSLSSSGPWVQLGTAGANVTNYASGGLSPGTTYYYRVCAYNSRGSSAYSSVANATTSQSVLVDTTAPSVPAGLTATAVTASQINLSWGAATDTGGSGLAGYKVYRNGVQIGTTTTTSYSNAGLAASTTYSYTVGAYDVAGNTSSQSAPASATTPAAPDTTAPSVPAGLTATAVTASQINLSWSAATDTGGSGLAGYKVYRNGVQIGTTTTTSYSNAGLAASTTYSYTVGAYDVAGNTSSQSAPASATTPAAPDTTAPSVPAGLTATAVTASQINLSWSAATDTGGSGLAGYKVYRNGVQIGTTTTTSYSNAGLAASTTYSYTVGAYDVAGNTSGQSAPASATTPAAPDTTAPSVPAGLTATAVTASQINLSWSAATDTGGSGLAGYKVYRNGVQIGTTTTTSYSNAGLAASTTYSYTVGAYDVAGNTSGQSAPASATTPAAPDTTAPSVPAGLTATAVTASQINLSWSAATDTGGSGLAGYKVYRNGVQIGTTTTTSYSNAGLAASTTYSYTVGAYDVAGNTSGQSAPASATTSAAPDTTAPSVPAGLTATAVTASQINLSWGAATDTGGSGLAGYKVYRNGVQIGTTTTTSYSNAGLAASTTYSYTVGAYDVAGNTSSQSAQASATTSAAPDTTAPSVPAGLTATAVTTSQINLSWGAATDTGGSGLAGYKVYRNGVQIGTTTTTSYSNAGLAASTTYSYTVGAYDVAGNTSSQSAQASATTPAAPDTTAPSVPAGLTATAVTASQINLSWSAATDTGGSGLAGYKVYRNGAQIGTTTTTSYSSGGLAASTTYSYTVGAYDVAGNTSGQSAQASATTPAAPDTTAPSVPAGLTATAVTASQINLSWSAATDTGGSGLAGYKVYRDGAQIGTTTTTSYSNAGLAASTTYSYTVGAYDVAGNTSGQSAQASATTPAAPDTTAPSVPAGLTAAAASSSQINLSWSAATDTGGSGLAGYKIYRSGVQIGTTTTTSYSNAGLAASTTYSYTVGAYDVAGNTSGQSAQASATTPATADTTAPSIPTGLTAAAASSSQINLSWSAATDTGGSGLAGYKVYRSGVQIGTTTTTSYSSAGLAASTTYSYTVAAYDVAGNTSGQSAQASATTPATADTTAPSIPTGLTAAAASSSQINLSWSAATDTGGSGLAGYKVYRSGVQIGTSTTTSYSSAGLAASTTYSYTVAAYDVAGNTSGQSAQASATTPGTGTTDTNAWVRGLGGNLTDMASVVAIDTGGNYVVAGNFSSTATFGTQVLTSAGGRDIFIAKLGSDGTVQWARAFGGAGDEYVNAIVLDGNNNIFLGGNFQGSANFGAGGTLSAGRSDAWLAKYLPDGSFDAARGSWVKTFGSTNDDMICGMDLDLAQQNIVVTGSFTGVVDFGGTPLYGSSIGTDSFLAKYSTSNGAHVFSKNFPNSGTDSGVRVFVPKSSNPNSDIVLVGNFAYSIDLGGGALVIAGGNDIYIGRFTASGSHLWSKRYGGTNPDMLFNAALDSHGGLVLAGTFKNGTDLGGGAIAGTGGLSTDMFLAKYSAVDGSFAWARPLRCSSFGNPYAVAVDSQDNPVITGGYNGTCTIGAQSFTSAGTMYDTDLFVAKYSGAGALLWAESLGGIPSESPYGAAIDRGNCSVIVGSFIGTANFGGASLTAAGGSADAFVLKLEP